MTHLSRFSNFPARFYLDKYYSRVGVENEGFMRAVAESVQAVDKLGTVVELGGGPSLCGMFAMTAATRAGPERVIWVDVAIPNLAEIEAWLQDSEDAFDYTEVFRWIARQFGADAAKIARRLRGARWEMHQVDLWDGLPGDLRGVGDVVGSYFVAESATADEHGFVALTSRVLDAASPGACVALAYIRRSGPYSLDDATLYPAVAVDEDSLPGLLDAAGLRFAEVEIHRGALQDPPARPGYDGMVFVSGRLAMP